MNIAAGKVLTDDEVFELVNKVCSSLPAGYARDGFKVLAKSHEALRSGLVRIENLVDTAVDALTKAKRKS
jgi:hypothetical protein